MSGNRRPQSPLRDIAIDAGIALLFVLVGYVFTYSAALFLDIGLYDEAYYLRNGLELFNVGIPPAHGYPRGAPLYAIWYWLLSLLRNDPVTLYYLNYRITTVMPSLMCLLFLRVSRVARTPAVLVSLFLLFANASFGVTPRISHFALAILLIGMASALLVPRAWRMSVYAVTALLASYVRPELFLAFLCLFSLHIGLSCWQSLRQRTWFPLAPLAVNALSCGALLFALGVSWGSMGRSWEAFQQHYSLNVSRWSSSEVNPWTNTERFVKTDFPHARTVQEALRENPVAFGKHVASNITQLPGNLKNMFLRPYVRFHTSLDHEGAIFLLAVLTLIFLVPRDRGEMWREALFHVRASWLSSLAVLLMLIPPLVSSVVIYPREHYLLLVVILPLHGLAVFARSHSISQKDTAIAVAVLALALFMAQPADTGNRSQPNRAVIAALRSLNISRPVNLLEAEGEYGVYVGENYNCIAEYSKSSFFNDFVEQKSIDAIILSDHLRADTRFRDDPEWQSFLVEPSVLGFTAIAVPGAPERRILVRNWHNAGPQAGNGDKSKKAEQSGKNEPAE